MEGPPHALRMLEALAYAPEVIDRVCYLIAHHHTYDGVEGLDYRILLEADFLVNLYEDGASPNGIKAAYSRIFRTEAGRWLCAAMFSPHCGEA